MHHHMALLWGQQPTNAAQQGGFAAPVGPHDGIETALLYLEVDVGEHVALAEGTRYVVEGNHGWSG
jgi:hypothetical protein